MGLRVRGWGEGEGVGLRVRVIGVRGGPEG